MRYAALFASISLIDERLPRKSPEYVCCLCVHQLVGVSNSHRRWVGFVDVRDICQLALEKGLARRESRSLLSTVARLFKRDDDRRVAKASNASKLDPFLKISRTANLQEVRMCARFEPL